MFRNLYEELIFILIFKQANINYFSNHDLQILQLKTIENIEQVFTTVDKKILVMV